ncbi:MAG TPA: LysR family transcriptional regulator [Bradyrhizobium sp.]|nr:LysR family transcriptional regulator [Bradyrhizobium sp.]
MRYVLTVARERALAPAARTLRVNETTISRRIARAELAMGTQLFHRTRGMLLPTEIGQIVVQYAEHIEAEIETLGELATGVDSRAAGSVRLTASPWLLNRVVVPAIGELKASHPMLRLELVAEPRNLSLTKREADLALRLARPDKEQSVIARRIGDLPFAVYGHRVRRNRSLPWITLDDAMAHLPNAAWMTRIMQEERAGPPALIANDSEIILHAVRAGLGKSLLPCIIADREPGVVRLSGETPILSRELWLLVHPDIRHLARIKAVIAWLEQIVARALTAPLCARPAKRRH